MAVHASGAAGKAKMLRLSSFAVARGMRTGMFRSFFRGRGIEFDSVRQYQYGDDVRAIDWNVSARTGKTYVKTFAEERDMALFLVLDASLSMHTGTGRKTRLDQALESAALLAFAAEQLPCPVGGVVFGGETGTFRRPAEGPDNVLSLLHAFESFRTDAPGSALSEALRGCLPLLPPSSLVVVLSDFRVSGFRQALEQLAGRHRVIAVRITDPSDFSVPGGGVVRFQDPETGACMPCRPDGFAFRSAWEKDGKENAAWWRSLCLRSGVFPFSLSVDSDAAAALSSFFASNAGGGV